MYEGRGSTKARMKKNDGYSRVPLDAVVVRCLLIVILLFNQVIKFIVYRLTLFIPNGDKTIKLISFAVVGIALFDMLDVSFALR